MVALTIKNIPDKLYALLKKQAILHRRSLNSEVIVCLEHVLQEDKLQPESLIKQAQRLRQKTKGFNLTQHMIQTAKEHGRP